MLCYVTAFSETSGNIFFYFSKMLYLMVSKKIHYLCEDDLEKSVPRYHRLSSLCKPHDANK